MYTYTYTCTYTYMAVSILYPSITFIHITHQGNLFVTHAFHNIPLGPCGLGPCGPGWALACRAFVAPLGTLWAGPFWASLAPCGLGP